MDRLLKRLAADFPGLVFEASDVFMWSPSRKTVFYSAGLEQEVSAPWSLLHELGHAELGHTTYRDDLQLMMMEVAAWQRARELAERYGVRIDEGHVESCLDSYRAWIHQRSRCVECAMHALPLSDTAYRCHNCGTSWSVPASRLCQVRRRRLRAA